MLVLIMQARDIASRHIVGGEVYYECLGEGAGGNTRNYRITMKIYRDGASNGAQFDSPARLGVFSYINGVYMFVRYIDINPTGIRNISNEQLSCVTLPPEIIVEEATYTQIINNLPVINGSYVFSWQRCCRNNTITNILMPENTGATYMIEITEAAQRSCNHGPKFKGFPPIGVCVNVPINFDHAATDLEGDVLIYEFCAPLAGGGPSEIIGVNSCQGIIPDPANCPPPFDDVIFRGPQYSAVNPLGTTSPVSINPTTGFISGTPRTLGQFVVGICVKEYRDGVLLSVLRRDFQFNVVVCESVVKAAVAADAIISEKDFVINSCGNNTVTFINESQLERFISKYRWTFSMASEVVELNTRDATVTFPGIGTYSGRLIINEGEVCSDTAFINVNIFPSINADFEFDYDTCVGGIVSFTDQSFTGATSLTNWEWDFGDENVSGVRHPDHLYMIPGHHPVSLIVTDNNECQDTLVQVIPYFPVPPLVVVSPDVFIGCVPEDVTFTNLSVPIDESYDIQWDFGDGGTSTAISPVYTYHDPGIYSVKVSITSPIGCYIEEYFPNLINMKESPVAGFEMSPEVINSIHSTVSFTDQSQLASGWYWDFGGQGSSFVRNPVFTFPDTGIAEIVQVVFHPNGCTDTVIQTIDIEPVVQFFLPNAFTPNYDGKNEIYKPKGLPEGVKYYSMSIWSRWGEKLFETRDPADGWNGRKNNSGQDLSGGVYLCVLQYRDARDRTHELKEFVTLIR